MTQMIKPIIKIFKKTNFYKKSWPKFGRIYYRIDGVKFSTILFTEIDNVIIDSCIDYSKATELSHRLFNNIDFLSDILYLVENKASLQQDGSFDICVTNLLSKIQNMPCNILNSRQWKDLCIISHKYGLYYIGYTFRQKAIDYLYKKGIENKDIDEICELFTAAIELRDYKTAKHILDKRLNGWRKLTPGVKKATLIYYLFCNNANFKSGIRKRYNKADKQFAEYLNGKTIAVVGPAKAKESNGNE